MNKVETITDDRRHLLAPFRGEKPPAPQWFEDAIALAPERSFIDAPKGLNRDACLGRARQARICRSCTATAPAPTGGVSSRHSLPTRIASPHSRCPAWAARAGATRTATISMSTRRLPSPKRTGLFASTAKPVIIGHSFGAFITAGIVGRAGGSIGGAIMLDGPFLGSAARRRQREMGAEHRGRSVSTTRWSKRCRASASRRIRVARTCSSPTGSRDHRFGSFAAPTTASVTHGGSIRSASWAFGTAPR